MHVGIALWAMDQFATTGKDVLLEACVDSVAGARAAARAGAGRLELCDDLLEGGTTPSAGMIAAVREAVSIPLFVIVRPRGGDFVHDADEVDVMRRDVATARMLGADGVVIGSLTADGEIDHDAMARLIEVAHPLGVTCHRAFDAVRDQERALERLVALGVQRVLTSGAAPSASEGVARIRALVAQAAGRIHVMAGGGVTPANAGTIVRETGVRELHARAAVASPGRARWQAAELAIVKPPPPGGMRWATDEGVLRAILAEASAAARRPGGGA